MVDFDTLVQSLNNYGFAVERVFEVPSNAGDAELIVDGQLISLSEARQLLADAEFKRASTQQK